MDIEQKAIERIKMASEISLKHYEKPIVLCYSVGKDSDVLIQLFEMAGVPYVALHSLTTADAPETVYHVRKVFHDLKLKGTYVEIDKHVKPDGSRVTMWNLIPMKLMPPTRLVRYCCSTLKEGGGRNSMIATGVRWAESIQRQNRETYEIIGSTKNNKISLSDEKMLITDNDTNRRFFEKCDMKAKSVVNPIIDWKDTDLWDFVKYWKIKLCKVYECGFRRAGCIGCPMAAKMRAFEFKMYPTYKMAYIHAFDRMLVERNARKLPTQWKSGEEVFHWWMEDPNIFGQMSFEDFPELMPDDDY